MVEGWYNDGKEGHECQILPKYVLSVKWIESMSDLLFIIAVPLNILQRNSNSRRRLSLTQVALAQRTKVYSTECLLIRWWYLSTVRYRLVGVGFLYIVCPK
jgi:hypothetical protein